MMYSGVDPRFRELINVLFHLTQPLGRADADRGRAVHGRARHVGRERGSSSHEDRPRVLRERSAVGHHGLRHRLRRVPAARRAPRRPLRAAPPLHDRPARLRRRVRPLGARLVVRLADRVPRRAGSRRRALRAGRVVAADDDVHRGSRPQPRDRRLGGRLGQRRRGRRPPRRRAHVLPELAVDLLRQRAGRARRRRADAAVHRRGEADRRCPPLRRRGCSVGDVRR